MGGVSPQSRRTAEWQMRMPTRGPAPEYSASGLLEVGVLLVRVPHHLLLVVLQHGNRQCSSQKAIGRPTCNHCNLCNVQRRTYMRHGTRNTQRTTDSTQTSRHCCNIPYDLNRPLGRNQWTCVRACVRACVCVCVCVCACVRACLSACMLSFMRAFVRVPLHTHAAIPRTRTRARGLARMVASKVEGSAR